MARQLETRMKIINAIEKLLKTRNPDDIRVSEVCRLSGISRTTFYAYFEDVLSAIQWLWDDLCSCTLYRINSELSWEEGHRAMLSGLASRSVFYQKVFVSKDYRSLFAYGYRKSLIHHIENIERRLERPLTEQELFELDYSVRALSAMTTKWAEEGMEPSVESMTQLFSRFIPSFARTEALPPRDAQQHAAGSGDSGAP